MPRIDSSEPDVAAELNTFGISFAVGELMDVCWTCWKWHFEGLPSTELVHPAYGDSSESDDPHVCGLCGVILDEADD